MFRILEDGAPARLPRDAEPLVPSVPRTPQTLAYLVLKFDGSFQAGSAAGVGITISVLGAVDAMVSVSVPLQVFYA